MLINKNIAIHTNRLVLVPYYEHHVRKYHRWMKDPDIQAATASEPLCLADEFRMQQSWRTDSDKLTFITCLPLHNHVSIEEIRAMLGDVNLFILTNEEENGDIMLVGELEVMIALKENQIHGLGRAAMLIFLKYVLTHESEILKEYFTSPREQSETSRFDYLRVKIRETNGRSIALFESIGFTKTEASPNFFEEFELRNGRPKLGDLERWMAERDVTDYEEIDYIAAQDEAKSDEIDGASPVWSGVDSHNSSQG